MRYLNISMILASTVFLTLACGDSGTDDGNDDATDTETAGDGDGDGGDGDGDGGDGDGDAGDGDGDGGDGDGDAGDGDGDAGDGDGDGDGDGGDGDGDGDGDGGDGDGDQGCEPLGNTECDACMAENCCDEIMACAANQDCACISQCVGGGGQVEACLGECMVNPNNLPQELMQVRACQLMECIQECAMP